MLSQQLVSNAHVMVVGCGALGNEVLKNLVLSGVKHIVIVDFDDVEMSNLTRSVLFRRSDAETHRHKVEAIAERLLQLNPALDLELINGDIAHDVGLGLIGQMDAVVSCVDNRWARYMINRHCMRMCKPWVDGGIDRLEGTARVFAPGRNCYACNLGDEGRRDLQRRMSCAGVIRRQEAAGHVPTTPVIASVIGAVEAQECLKIVAMPREDVGMSNLPENSLCGRMFYYEGEHLTSRFMRFEAYDEDCVEHDCWEPVVKTDINIDMTVGDVIDKLQSITGHDDVTLLMRDDCFVDQISHRDNETSVSVMLPGHRVEAFVERHPQLSAFPMSKLYQHEYHRIDRSFPYSSLTLRQLGIPPHDVLHVMGKDDEFFFEIC